MKVGSYIYTNSYAPADTNQLWVKPMSNGEAVLYIFVDGKWTPTGGVGESAYSAAVKEGFVGTKSEWLESLALKYSDLTPAQKAELAQPAAEQAALAAQYAETIHQAIDDLDPSQSSDDAIVAEAAVRASKDSELETTLNALGPKINNIIGIVEIPIDILANGNRYLNYNVPYNLGDFAQGDKVEITLSNPYNVQVDSSYTNIYDWDTDESAYGSQIGIIKVGETKTITLGAHGGWITLLNTAFTTAGKLVLSRKDSSVLDAKYVRYDEQQTLSQAQKAQVLSNLGIEIDLYHHNATKDLIVNSGQQNVFTRVFDYGTKIAVRVKSNTATCGIGISVTSSDNTTAYPTLSTNGAWNVLAAKTGCTIIRIYIYASNVTEAGTISVETIFKDAFYSLIKDETPDVISDIAISSRGVYPFAKSAFKHRCGKNLCNPKDPQFVVGKFVYSGNGEIRINAGYGITPYIPVSQNGLTCNYPQTSQGYAVYDANYAYLRSVTGSGTYTYEVGDAYVRFNFNSANKETIQVEEGTSSTEFEEYNPIAGQINELNDGPINNLNVQLNGGFKVVGNKSFYVSNNHIDANNASVELTTPVNNVTFRLEGSSDCGITSITPRLVDTNGNSYYFSTYPLNTDVAISERSYLIAKVQIAAVAPAGFYTGQFRLIVRTTVEGKFAKKEDIIPIKEQIEYDERLNIPSYYFVNDYLPNKVDFIRNLLEGCMANGDAFFFQTDEHWENNARRSPALIKYITDRLHISRLFDGGDTTHNIDSWNHTYTNPLAIDFEKLRQQSYRGRLFHVIGNHEYLTAGYININQYDNTDFGNWHDYLYFQHNVNDRMVIDDITKHNYYVDNPFKKIRYIVLSSFKKKETPIESGQRYVTVAEADFSNEQLLWFTNTALNVEAGWTILVFTHMFCGFNYGEKDGQGYVQNVSQYVLSAAIPFAQAMLNYNGQGEIAAVIQGHLHADAVFLINDTTAGLTNNPTGKSIPCIATTCDAYNFSGTEALYNRTIDTITEQAFDVAVLDKTAKKLTFVRIGAPAYDILTQASNGKYPLFGDLEYREVTYGNS